MALLYRMGMSGGTDIKPYIVNFTCSGGYYGQTITLHYLGTETVDDVSGTVSNNGTLTLYPMHSGNWKVTAYSTIVGTYESTIEDLCGEQLEKWGNYEIGLNDIPDGESATANNVQTWIRCANVWNKQYTTVSEVINDSSLFNTLLANENANTYLARSINFASDICASEYAMTLIGTVTLSDGVTYDCADKLLSNSDWTNTICNSAYCDKVLNVKVPTMTSDTSPSGTVIYDTKHAKSGEPWHVFNSSYYSNRDISNGWYSATPSSAGVGYKFTIPVNVRKVEFREGTYQTYYGIKSYKIQWSDTGNSNDWHDVPNSTGNYGTHDANIKNTVIEDSGKHLYWKFYVIDAPTPTMVYVAINMLQFYGRG